MPIQAFTDIVSVVVVLAVVIWFNTLGITQKNGTFHLIAGFLGLFSTGWLFSNGALVYQSVYSGGAWVNQSVDPNLFAAVLAVTTIASFLFIYFARYD